MSAAFARLLLALGDDKLLLGHRNSDWTGLGPMLEEDIAFSSIAQDEIAHALSVYEVAGGMLDRTPDQLAFHRTPEEYLCATIVEPNDEFDWALAIVRQFFCDHFDAVRLARLSKSSDAAVAALAKRLAAEETIHTEHSAGWIRRLGRGSEEARERVQAALETLAPFALGLFEPVDGQGELGVLFPGDDPTMYTDWLASLRVATDGGALSLPLPDALPAFEPGGRAGHHTPELAELLDEMGVVCRSDPEATW